MSVNEKSITGFLSDEYKEFAMYTIENRALPSSIDGFKSSQRKVVHISNRIWKTGKEKPIKVFQLCGKVSSDCLEYNSEILLSNGETIKIGDWFSNHIDSEFEVMCIDENGKLTKSIGSNPRFSLQTEIYEIKTENGIINKLSANHMIMLSDMSYKKVSDLTKNDDIFDSKIKSIKKIKLDQPQEYYDISVDKYHNFIINNSIVVHNCFYHHGDSSLSGVITTMAQKFKNNAPLLEEDGQFGSLRAPQAGAPRYIGTKLSENFKLLYKDFELLTYKEEEGEIIEPTFFLPVIPTVLVNGSSGIAVGFASQILNRDVKDLVKAVVEVLNNKVPKEIKPSSPYFKGEWIQDPTNNKRWTSRGIFERQGSTKLRITELPMSITYEKYEALLDKLVDDKYIIGYDDNCKDNVDYTIRFGRGVLDNISDEEIIKKFKLEESVTEIFSTLDENNRLKIFESTTEIVQYFVDFRLKYYIKRREVLLDKIKNELNILSNRGKFIKYILDNKLKVNNVKKDVIISELEKLGLDKNDGSYDYLLRMPIYSLTNELYEKLKQDFLSKKEEHKKVSETDPKDMYIEDLKEIKNKFKYDYE